MILLTDNSTNDLQDILQGSQKILISTPVYKIKSEQEIVNNGHFASE